MNTPLQNSVDTKIARPSRASRLVFRQNWVRRAVWLLLFLLLSIGGTILCVGTLGRSVYRWHGFAVELRLLPAQRGETVLVLIPLGAVEAHTHRAPVALIATLQEIEIEEIKKVLNSNPRLDVLTRDFETSARQDLNNFVIRQLVFGALGAMLAPLLLRSRKLWKYAASALFGLAIVGVTLGSALATFNGKAFESPTYTGALRQAPWVIQFGKDAFVRIEELSQKLRTVAANLNVLYGRIAAPPDRLDEESDAETVRILHVSDLHNNLAGVKFMQEVAHQFRVSMIVDTGDLTDFGSPPETVIVQQIRDIGYPYLFVAGNHDSQTVVSALAALPNVTVLNGQLVTEKGFTFLGLPNPASARASVGNVDTTPEELQAGSSVLLETVRNLREPPDILAIHNPEEARPLWGSVPLVLCGHLHRWYVEVEKGKPSASEPPDVVSAPGTAPPTAVKPRFDTVVCNAGTTGAAGLRYFEREQGVPFSCAVLTFRRPTANLLPTGPTETSPNAPASVPRPQLLSIDQVVLDGALHKYSITHTPFAATEAHVNPH